MNNNKIDFITLILCSQNPAVRSSEIEVTKKIRETDETVM